jgi:hypothetical protein
MNTPIITLKSKCEHPPVYVIRKNEIRCLAFCPTCDIPVEVETKEVELEPLEKPDTLDPNPKCC